ncbi:MAG: hypothetical protein GXO07_05355 [Crenarchaeota archaeon]|nr:hypothetical protein [Thermoproteota archaeon]
MKRNALILVIAALATFVLSYIAYSSLKVEAQGPLAKVVEKIIYGFQLKHCEWIKPLMEHGINVEELVKEKCNVSLNSGVVAFSEALATTAFVIAILGTLMFWRKRLSFVMIGVATLLFLGAAPFKLIIEHMELGLILFLISMMVIVEYLSESGVLGWITVKLVKASGFKPFRFLVILGFLSWIMAALVDEVTSIVFVTKVVISIASMLNMNPIPLVIYSVFATNIGSSATMIGNPIGIYIALQSGKTFGDFLQWATPGSIAALLVLLPFSAVWLRKAGLFKKLKEKGSEVVLDEWSALGISKEEYEKFKRGELRGEDAKRVEEALRRFRLGWAFFITVLTLIALHTIIADLINAGLDALYALMTGAGEASIHARVTSDAVLIFSPIVVAAVLMLLHEEPRRLIEKGVEWWTLVFFMFLFAIASALSYTGVTDKMAYALVQSVGGLTFESTITLAIMITIISAVISAFLDNMPVVVALTPVVKTLIEIGLPGGDLLWWSLLYGATMGGNMSLIGSTANIVALGILERHGKVVRFWDWFKVGVPVVAITLGVAMAILLAHGYAVYSGG